MYQAAKRVVSQLMGGGSPECPVCRVLKLGILDAIIRQAEVQKLPGRAPELLRVRAEAGLERNGAEGKYHAHARSRLWTGSGTIRGLRPARKPCEGLCGS